MSSTFSDLDRGWSWVVMVACFVASFVISGTNYSVGLIHTTLLEKYHENHSTTSLVGALHTAVMNLAAPLSSIVVDKFSTRTAIITSGVLYTIGYMASAFAPSLTVTIFTCGIISGFGGAVGWTASMIGVGFHFRRYRNLAQGVAMSGAGMGIFGIPPAIQKAKEMYGSMGYFVTLSCITMHLIIAGTAMIPSKLEIHTHKKRFDEYDNKGHSSAKSIGFIRTYVKVFATKSITCLSLSMFMFCFGTYIVFLYLPNYCIEQGATQMQSSFVISICGAASIFGRLVTGIVGNYDRVDEIVLYSGSMAIVGVGTLLFPLLSKVYSGQLAYSILLGLFFGSSFVTITPINISFVGVANMAAALGIELCLGGVGAIVGPVLAGLILDKWGSYDTIFIIAGAVTVAAALLGVLSAFLTKRLHGEGMEQTTIVIDTEALTASQKMLETTATT